MLDRPQTRWPTSVGQRISLGDWVRNSRGSHARQERVRIYKSQASSRDALGSGDGTPRGEKLPIDSIGHRGDIAVTFLILCLG